MALDTLAQRTLRDNRDSGLVRFCLTSKDLQADAERQIYPLCGQTTSRAEPIAHNAG
ncbi:MAG: hypothetical protein AB8B57_06410 [Congregibacter sp.]